MPQSLSLLVLLLSAGIASAEIPMFSLTDLGPQGVRSISKEGSVIVGDQVQNGPQIAQEFSPQNRSLGTLGGGSSQAFAASATRIVGTSQTVDDFQSAFVFENDQMTALEGSNANALNADDICGDSNGLPVCWIQGVRTEFPTLSGGRGSILGLNEKGNAVGNSRTASGDLHCAFWPVQGGVIDCSPGTFSSARDINDSNVIVGEAGGQGFFFFFGLTPLPPVAGLQVSRAVSINDMHLTVGQSWSAVNGAFHSADAATIWENGVPTDLQDRLTNPGSYRLIAAFGIDNDNRIVATADLNGQTRSVLLTPVLNRVAAWYFWKYDVSRYYTERFDRWKKIIAQYYARRR